jgi:hypothetical protein
MRGPGLVTPDMLSMQRALDHNETMLLMNNSYAGFRERLFLNTEPPTFYQKINGKDVETDAPVNVGPGSTMFLQGVAVEDEVTKELKGYATPSVTYIDPVNQEGLINSIKHVKYQLHEGMFQAHLQISGDSTSSGQSRIQAVQDHISSLRIIERQASSMIKWLLETLLHFSAALSGNEGKYLPLKAVVQCKISPVVLTPEERTAIREEYNQELHSQEGAMTLLGVDNPAEEILKIRAEKQEAIDLGLDLIPGDNPGQPAIVPQSRT